MQTVTSPDSLLLTIVLGTLAIGLPILFVLAIRFLWDRHLYLGRSKELEKLVWQLHRIASAMEHQMNLSFPAVQPGTEEASDLAYFQQLSAQAKAAPRAAATAQRVATPNVAAPATPQPATAQVEQPQPAAPQPAAPQPAQAQATPADQAALPPATPEPAEQQSELPPLVTRDPSEPPRHAGVNSMFGF